MSKRRNTRPNFNAGAWADALELILGVALFIGVIAFVTVQTLERAGHVG